MSNVIEMWPSARQRDDAAAYMQRVSEHEGRAVIPAIEPPADYSDEAIAYGFGQVAAFAFAWFAMGCLFTALAALVLSRVM